jgi:hypothetical protein
MYRLTKKTDSIYFFSSYYTQNSYLAFNSQINCVDIHASLSGNTIEDRSFIRNISSDNRYYFATNNLSGGVSDVVKSYYYFYKDGNNPVETWGTPLNLKTLSVNDIAKTSISVYPNPNQTGNFYINTNEKIHWEVTDIQGVKIANGNTPSINLSSKNAGIYLLKTEINGQIYYSKLLKQ